MRTLAKYVVTPAILLLVVFLSYKGWYYIEVVRPNEELAELSVDWFTHNGENVPHDKLRKVCHKVLSHRDGNHHDAFMMLGAIGNQKSIPYLMKAFRWEHPPSDDGGVCCSTLVCVGALRKVTGMELGFSYAEWDHWWKTEGAELPEEMMARSASNYWEKVRSDRYQSTRQHKDPNECQQGGGEERR